MLLNAGVDFAVLIYTFQLKDPGAFASRQIHQSPLFMSRVQATVMVIDHRTD